MNVKENMSRSEWGALGKYLFGQLVVREWESHSPPPPPPPPHKYSCPWERWDSFLHCGSHHRGCEENGRNHDRRWKSLGIFLGDLYKETGMELFISWVGQFAVLIVDKMPISFIWFPLFLWVGLLTWTLPSARSPEQTGPQDSQIRQQVPALLPNVIAVGPCVRKPRKLKNHNQFWKVSCLCAWRSLKAALVTHLLKVERRPHFGSHAFRFTGLALKAANHRRACTCHHSFRNLSLIWTGHRRERSSVSILSR